MMEDTIFGKIIRREVAADIVYEDDETLAFLDIKPIHPGHTLVVPKRAFRNLFDMDEVSLAALMCTVQKVARAVKTATDADGINVGMNNEAAAGQVVFHAHAHIIPRFTGDGLHAWDRVHEYAESESAGMAEKIRGELA